MWSISRRPKSTRPPRNYNTTANLRLKAEERSTLTRADLRISKNLWFACRFALLPFDQLTGRRAVPKGCSSKHARIAVRLDVDFYQGPPRGARRLRPLLVHRKGEVT